MTTSFSVAEEEGWEVEMLTLKKLLILNSPFASPHLSLSTTAIALNSLESLTFFSHFLSSLFFAKYISISSTKGRTIHKGQTWKKYISDRAKINFFLLVGFITFAIYLCGKTFGKKIKITTLS